MQRKIGQWWCEFWEWVVETLEGQPFIVVCNGDAIDGVHHGSTHQISHNLADQVRIAYKLLAPIRNLCDGRYYHIRGTEAHAGKSGTEEERLAEMLGAIPNSEGQYARYDLNKQCGKYLVNIMHHIGTTGSSAYESTAVHKEFTEALIESARWQRRAPDCIVRSHRHRFLRDEFATASGSGIAIVTPGWQAKTPFAYKVAGARQSQPQFGGVIIRAGENTLYTRHWIKTLKPSEAE